MMRNWKDMAYRHNSLKKQEYGLASENMFLLLSFYLLATLLGFDL